MRVRVRPVIVFNLPQMHSSPKCGVPSRFVMYLEEVYRLVLSAWPAFLGLQHLVVNVCK